MTHDTKYRTKSNKDCEIFVVVRYFSGEGKWFICHAKSYQNAFRKGVNGFKTRDNAVRFAENNKCQVTWHYFDILQRY